MDSNPALPGLQPQRDSSREPQAQGSFEPVHLVSAMTAHGPWRGHYLLLLGWAFTFFSSVRVFSYLPTLWAIWQAQDSSQHSLLTWATWLGSNLTMAAWLHEHQGRAVRAAVLVNLLNAAMCTAVLLLILAFRIQGPGAAAP